MREWNEERNGEADNTAIRMPAPPLEILPTRLGRCIKSLRDYPTPAFFQRARDTRQGG